MKVLYAQFRVYPDDVIHFQIPGKEINRSYGAVVEIHEPSIAKYVEEHCDELAKVKSFATDKSYIPCVLQVTDEHTYVNLTNAKIFQITTPEELKEIEQNPWEYTDRINDTLKELLPEKKVTEQEIVLSSPEEEETIEGKTPLIWQETDEVLLLTWGKFIIHLTPRKFEIYLK